MRHDRSAWEGTYNEAEREERVALDDVGGHVSTVMALANETLVALELLAERVLAADEEEKHGDGLRCAQYWWQKQRWERQSNAVALKSVANREMRLYCRGMREQGCRVWSRSSRCLTEESSRWIDAGSEMPGCLFCAGLV